MRVSILGSVAALAIAACNGSQRVPDPRGDGPAVTDQVIADLQFLREEEKLARDVYTRLFDRWQLMPHQRIASSEQIHMDHVLTTLQALDLTDPVRDDTVGAFVDPRLAGLFAELVATGERSELDSLQVGATVEDLDLRDLDRMASHTTDPGILSTYAVLQCGSRNHLRAFTSQLAMRGASYAPQYIPQATFDAVLAANHEQCGH